MAYPAGSAGGKGMLLLCVFFHSGLFI